MLTMKGINYFRLRVLTDGVGQDTAWKYFSNQASGYQSYSRVPPNMPFATRRLNRMHRHCLENSGWESDTLGGGKAKLGSYHRCTLAKALRGWR